MNPVTVDKIVMACICLQNFLKTKNDALPVRNHLYCPPNFVDIESQNGDVVPGEWRNENNEGFQGFAPSNAHRTTSKAYN